MATAATKFSAATGTTNIFESSRRSKLPGRRWGCAMAAVRLGRSVCAIEGHVSHCRARPIFEWPWHGEFARRGHVSTPLGRPLKRGNVDRPSSGAGERVELQNGHRLRRFWYRGPRAVSGSPAGRVGRELASGELVRGREKKILLRAAYAAELPGGGTESAQAGFRRAYRANGCAAHCANWRGICCRAHCSTGNYRSAAADNSCGRCCCSRSGLANGGRHGERMVKITVLMAVRDTPADMLRQAIESIRGQTLREFEFLIFDDGSERPETCVELERQAAADSRIRLVRGPPRGLTADAQSRAGAGAGELIARQDADDWSEPDRLERQAAFLDSILKSPYAAAMHGPTATTGVRCGRRACPKDPAAIREALWKGNPFVHGGTLFRTGVARELGGYREEFPSAQDYDFFWRLSDAGGAANLPEPLYHYRYSAGAVSARRAAEQARAHRAAQFLARSAAVGSGGRRGARAGASGMRVEAAGPLRTALKQIDHRLLAGDFGAAGRAYAELLDDASGQRAGVGKTAAVGSLRSGSAGAGMVLPMRPGAPRVLFVIPGEAEGSSMIFARRQAESLERQGVEVNLFHLRSRTSLLELAREWRRFRRRVRRVNPQVIHAHFGTMTALFAAWACCHENRWSSPTAAAI